MPVIVHNTSWPRGSTFETTVCSTREQVGEIDQPKTATVTEAGSVYANSGNDDACIKHRTNWDDCRAVDQ